MSTIDGIVMPAQGTPMLAIEGLSKTFTLHNQGGTQLPVFAGATLTVTAGCCFALTGVSGSGKSTLLRSIYANYLPTGGAINIRHGSAWIDMATAEPQTVLAVRRWTLGYVSQFLRVIPRVPTLDIVAEPLWALGVDVDRARDAARAMLTRLNLPAALWDLPPATFSGGEQQRVNIARSFVRHYPVLLLDEPTASLDAGNREVVVDLIREARAAGSAIVGIFHDTGVRDRVASSHFDVSQIRKAA